MKFTEIDEAAGRTAIQETAAPAIRVFLVEDMKHLQGAMADLLRSLGHFTLVGMASTEAEAIQWLTEHRDGWDLAVVDLVLEQGSGMGVVGRCRGRREGAKVVVLSEYVTPVIHDYCIGLGADAAILKTDMAQFMAYCQSLVPPD